MAKALNEYLKEFQESLIGKTFIVYGGNQKYKLLGFCDKERIVIEYEIEGKDKLERTQVEPFNLHLSDLEVIAENS